MSLVRKERLYKSYCDLCFYTGKKPSSKDKWKKQFDSSSKRNPRTVEDIKGELAVIKEYT